MLNKIHAKNYILIEDKNAQITGLKSDANKKLQQNFGIIFKCPSCWLWFIIVFCLPLALKKMAYG